MKTKRCSKNRTPHMTRDGFLSHFPRGLLKAIGLQTDALGKRGTTKWHIKAWLWDGLNCNPWVNLALCCPTCTNICCIQISKAWLNQHLQAWLSMILYRFCFIHFHAVKCIVDFDEMDCRHVSKWTILFNHHMQQNSSHNVISHVNSKNKVDKVGKNNQRHFHHISVNNK